MSILREELITNHLLLDYFDMWDEFDIKSANNTLEVRYYNQLMNLINSQLDAGIRWLDSKEAEDYFKGESQYQREVFQALEDEWDNILEGKYSGVEALLAEIYRRGKAKGYSDMRSRVRYTPQDKLALEFVTNYNFGLIQNIDSDVRSQIKGEIISGFLAGDHPNTIAPKISSLVGERLDGSNFTPRQRSTMIARTEVSRVQNTGILQSYVNEGYTEVKILTAEDDHVCDLCLRYAFEFNKDDDIVFENRGAERVHNILKLIKGGNFPPFHPFCRCTYLSVWRSKIDDDLVEFSEDKETVDLTLKRDSSKKPTNGKTDIDWENIKSPQDVADYFGYDYAFEDDRHYFYDSKGNTSIIIDRYHTIGKGSRYNSIDFENSGNGIYDLKEIIKIYDEAPFLLKKSTNEILFRGSKVGKPNTFGSSKPFLEEFNGISVTKRIKIFAPSILKNKNLRGNVAQTMYHEMFHCLEYSLINDPKLIDVFLNPKKYSVHERKEALSKAHPISNSDDWRDSCQFDEEYQNKNGFDVEMASKYSDKNEHEHFAEVGSMVAFNDIEDKTMAVQTDENLHSIEFEKWIKRHPYKYMFILSQLRKLKLSNLTFKSL